MTDIPHSIQILDCPMGENDANASTVREYLKTLLYTLWTEADGFSGKRPFGNSDWQYKVYEALGRAGFIHLELDEKYGWIEEVDDELGDKLILAAIQSLA